MQVSRIILILLHALMSICLEAMKHEESHLDADGCPLNDVEYDKLSYFRCRFADIFKDFEENEEK